MAKYGRGYKGKAVKLHALLTVEMRCKCERCGKKGEERECGHIVTRKDCECCMSSRRKDTLQCAHIISRSYSKVVSDLTNAYSFCGSCHIETTKWPVEFARFIFKRSGKKKYEELKAKAKDPEIKMTGDYWKREYARLWDIAEEHGIEHPFGPRPEIKEPKPKKKKKK